MKLGASTEARRCIPIIENEDHNLNKDIVSMLQWYVCSFEYNYTYTCFVVVVHCATICRCECFPSVFALYMCYIVSLIMHFSGSLRREGKGEEVEGSYMEFFRVG